MTRHPIGPSGAVSAQGRSLFYKNGSRFSLQGIAFPTAAGKHDADGWITVLDQLAAETDVNAVRVHQMNCTKDCSTFLNHATKLGICAIVPLTLSSGKGVLDRNKVAPKCHPRDLCEHGVSCLDAFVQHPNAVAGVIGNEVMNSVETWLAAPCVKACARDLKKHMQQNSYRSLPLVCAAQHDAITVEILPHQAMKHTLDYLSCGDANDGVDVFGINVVFANISV